jgi:hypothetical protein
VQNNSGEWQFVAFRNFDDSGEFVGEIIDPLPVEVDELGNLKIG